MDAVGYKHESHYTEADGLWTVTQKAGDLEQRSRDGESWKLVDVCLSGGAPWGFTLRGGLEHREPLLITKVEEGSKASAVSLQAGDELVNINEIPLSGFRQEAICLVKGSHKTLSLVVKRRSEPISRPHSWHATKFNESQSQTAKAQSPPTQVWQTRYDASSSSTDLSSAWEQTDLRRASDQFSSLGSMDSLEHVSHPYAAGQLSPAKSNNSMEHLGGGKRDSAYSSFSTSSGTPDYTLSKSDAASTENMLYKVGQWDAGGKQSNGRSAQSAADERVAYIQVPGVGAGPQADDSAGSRHSTSSRTTVGPVWHVPEAKKKASSSPPSPPPPPPPPPPARSDSFAATKVHERGLVATHPEGPEPHPENRRGHNPPQKNEPEAPRRAVRQVQPLGSSKQQSLSSHRDVRQGPPPHQGQHGDKSLLYFRPEPCRCRKSQNVGGYHSSMQELPTNGAAQHFGQNHRRNLSTSLSTAAAAEHNAESGPHSRYYCVTTVQAALREPPPARTEDRNGVTGSDLAPAVGERNSLSLQTVPKVTYHLPQQQQQHSSFSKDSNGYNKHQVTSGMEGPGPRSGSDGRGSPRGAGAEAQFPSHASGWQHEQRRPPPQHHQDVQHHGQAGNKICAQATPMLHFLSVDGDDAVAGQGEATRGPTSEESLDSKMARRSDRFATTLRNEIQMRRAKLQKSISAAALPGTEGGGENDQDVWKSPESAPPASFTGSYKDHVKEAQARVLKATSFRRKDLEPVLLEHLAAEGLPSYPSSRKDVAPLPTLSESAMSRAGPAGGQVTRIGSRKRFTAEKKVRSFSEPGQIHQVGVSSAPHQQQPCKEGGTPAVPNHAPHRSSAGNPTEAETRGLAPTRETEDPLKGARSRVSTAEVQEGPHSAHRQGVQDQQRLGTFAEYEARWSAQNPPPETRASGRYRSADNILDPGPEERTKTTCFHERSRSSPSADIYGRKIQVPARRFETEYSPAEGTPAERLVAATGFPDAGPPRRSARETHHPDLGLGAKHGPTPVPGGLTGSVTPPPEARRGASPPPRRPEVDSHEPPAGSQGETLTRCPPDPPTLRRESPSTATKDVRPPPTPGPLAMEEQRSPSPHFSPQRLSDKPPASLQDEDPPRTEHVVEKPHSAARKVPIRIVHSEVAADKEACPYLQHGDAPHAVEAEGPGVIRLVGRGAAGQDSGFCAFTRQGETAQADAYMTTVGDHGLSDGPPPAHAEVTEVTEVTRLSEDQKRDELARSIMGKDKSLTEILDQSKMKTTMDLMEGIFPQEEQLLEGAHQRRKVNRPAEEREKEDSVAAAVTMVTNSTYYSTSAPKAELLIKMKDMQDEEEEEEEDFEDELDIDLANKKQELIDSLSRKLQVLREARESLQEDILDNNALGDEVEVRVQQVCKPNELDKFRMFVGDLDKVVSLLLSLSGRLARVENALNSLEEDATAEERRTLTQKRKLLIRQHEDAKELKENLDRRERLVYDILAGQLPEDGLTDYEHFVKMKSALIIEQRKLEDKIKLGEEQLKCLTDSLPMEQRLAL
uniref:LOW QUALITY PROTEIN: protein Shroom2 n=1 Tax=Gasterosteus aculeatus aculeatus TaxID=481459 RepID=UPI001A99D349|nr:LOW QUALITY PROTEIN: protein Shroom2 [Gasterosteus aculeatus aculeatus]